MQIDPFILNIFYLDQKPIDVKVGIKPVSSTLVHKGSYEGPCRTGCIALSLLKDEGYPGICEGDLNAGKALMFSEYISK